MTKKRDANKSYMAGVPIGNVTIIVEVFQHRKGGKRFDPKDTTRAERLILQAIGMLAKEHDKRVK